MVHLCRVARVTNMPFIRFTVELRIEEIPLLTGGLLLFDRHTMGDRPGILPDAGYLPGDFHSRGAAADPETVAYDLPVYIDGRIGADAG